MAQATTNKKSLWKGMAAPCFLGWTHKGRSNMAKPSGNHGAGAAQSSDGSTGNSSTTVPTTHSGAMILAYPHPPNPNVCGFKHVTSPMDDMDNRYKVLKQSISPYNTDNTANTPSHNTGVYIDQNGMTQLYKRGDQ